MRLRRTDAGRESSGFDREKNDCTVRALAAAVSIPYTEAHNIAREMGRKAGRGMKTGVLLVGAQRHGVAVTDRSELVTGRPTLARFLPSIRKGRYILVVRGHAFAVIDGVIHDMDDPGARCRVRRVWEVLPATQPKIVAPEAPQPHSTPIPVITQTQINALWTRLDRFEAKY